MMMMMMMMMKMMMIIMDDDDDDDDGAFADIECNKLWQEGDAALWHAAMQPSGTQRSSLRSTIAKEGTA